MYKQDDNPSNPIELTMSQDQGQPAMSPDAPDAPEPCPCDAPGTPEGSLIPEDSLDDFIGTGFADLTEGP